jgi:hypothetical protein
MRLGILLAALGVVCYIVYAMLLNNFLRKNAPDVLEGVLCAPLQRQRRVFLIRGATPRWVTLLGLPALPLWLLGSVLIAMGVIAPFPRPMPPVAHIAHAERF